MTLGIAIPSYKEHIPYLYVLLDQISKSTINVILKNIFNTLTYHNFYLANFDSLAN